MRIQTGSRRSTALFPSALSRLTSRIPTCCASLIRSTDGLVSAFFPVGRLFGTSRPRTLACGLRKRPGSFLIGSHDNNSTFYIRTLTIHAWELTIQNIMSGGGFIGDATSNCSQQELCLLDTACTPQQKTCPGYKGVYDLLP